MTNKLLVALATLCILALISLTPYVLFGAPEGRFFGASPAYVELAQQPVPGAESSSSAEWLDLMEQRSMAMSTYLAQRSAFVQALTGLLSVALLVITVVFTKQAAASTRETLDIAQRTLKQNRAYMTFSEAFGTVYERSMGRKKAELTFKWVNSGDSPAVAVKSVQAWELLALDYAAPCPDLAPDDDQGAAVVGRGCMHPVHIRLRHSEVDDVMENRKQLVLHVAVFYEDVYGRGFKTMLTARVKFSSVGPGKSTGSPLNIDVIPIGPQQGEIQLKDEHGKEVSQKLVS